MPYEINAIGENNPTSTITITTESGQQFIYSGTVPIDPATNQPINYSETFQQILVELQGIKENTSPVVLDPVTNPSGIGMTFEQGQALLNSMQTVEYLGITLVASIFVLWVFKRVYNLLAGTFFGGL